MDFKRLEELLEQYFFDDKASFELPRDNDLESTAISQVIGDYLPKGTVHFTDQPALSIEVAKLPPSRDRVIIEGTAFLFRGQVAKRAVRATFEVVDEVAVMVVETTDIAAGYDLSNDFGALSDTPVAKLPFQTAKLILASASSEAALPPGTYEVGLNFNGAPSGSGSLEKFAWVFEDLAEVVVSGVITLGDGDRPLMTLSGRSPSSVSWDPVHVTPGVRVATRFVPPGTTQAYLALPEFRTEIELGNQGNGSSVLVPISVELLGDADSTTLLHIGDGSYTIAEWSELASLAPGHDFEALLPNDLPKATTLSVSELSLSLDLDDHTNPLRSIAVTVQLEGAKPWSLLPNGVLALSKIAASFFVGAGGDGDHGEQELIADGVWLGTLEGDGRDVGAESLSLSAVVSGRFVLGSGGDHESRYDVSVELPSLAASGALVPGDSIPAGMVINHFLEPFVGRIGGIEEMKVVRLDLLALPRDGAFFLKLEVDDVWKLKLLFMDVSLDTLTADVGYSANQVALSFGATATLFGAVPFFANAVRAPNGQGWQFTLGTPSGTEVDVNQAVENLVGLNPSQLPLLPDSLTVRDVLFDINSATRDFTFTATAAAGWMVDLGPIGEIGLEASVHFEATDASNGTRSAFALVHRDAETGAKKQYSGSISGKLTVGEFATTVTYAFVPDSSTLTFTFEFRRLLVTAVLTKEKDADGEENSILTASIGDLSFGEIVEYLVGLVDPHLSFQLEEPWTFLNDINFKNLQLKVNLTKKTVGIAYKVDREFVIVSLDTIGLYYVRGADGRHTVDIQITGRFVDQEYTDAKPLQWDMINDPAPQPPGKGSELLELRYLGLGQNVGFRSVKDFTTVTDVITAMDTSLVPVPEDENPLDNLPTLRFAGDGRWLIAADFTVMKTVSLTGVFADPQLYGLRVALSGDKAKALAGLEFEILYKKVTDHLGVYLIELKLPDALRELQFGAVSLTLPVIDLEIYTNGNFRVDIGFPWGGDFSRSFSFQYFPFVGFGGLYFGVKNGETSDRVPAISNGTFAPVLEFGVGLSVGLGKTINKGVLSAGVTLTVQGIVQGVLGWFNPTDGAAVSAEFFWIQGEIAIAGHLYGEVNFVIVSARVDVRARASATMTIEAFRATHVDLVVRVEASASIKILFVRIHFSFGIDLSLSFTIGEDTTPPWRVVESGGGQRLPRAGLAAAKTLRQGRNGYRPHRFGAIDLLRRLRLADPTAPEWDWTPTKVFDSPYELYIALMPSFTVAAPAGTRPPGREQNGDAPAVQVVMGAWVPNSIPSGARTAEEVMQVRMTAPEEAPFNRLAEGILRWALGALQRADPSVISAEELETIGRYLSDDAHRREVYQYRAVTDFLDLNYDVEVGTPLGPTGATGPGLLLTEEGTPRWGRWSKWLGDPGNPSIGELLGEEGPVGLAGFTREDAGVHAASRQAELRALGATGVEDSGTVFPMIPDLIMTPHGRPSTDFATHSLIGPEYEARLSGLTKALDIDPERDVPSDPSSKAPCCGPVSIVPPSDVAGTGTESMASFVFRDYMAMIAKSSVEAAEALLRRFPYLPQPWDTLTSIADQFPRVGFHYRAARGESLMAIAAKFALDVDQVMLDNPALLGVAAHADLGGHELFLSLGVTPRTLADANKDHALGGTASAPWLHIQDVRTQVRSGQSLAEVTGHFGVTGPWRPFVDPGLGNDTDTSLLQNSATFVVPQGRHYTLDANDTAAGDPLARVASFYEVRTAPPPTTRTYPYLAWYSQRIVGLNKDGPTGLDFADLSGSVGATLAIPVAAVGDTGLHETGTTTYAVRPADTLDMVAAYFELAQLSPTALMPMETKLRQLNPRGATAGQSVMIPELRREVQPADSVRGLSELYGAAIEDLLAVGSANATSAKLLRPLGVVRMPPIDHRVRPGDTLGGLAGRFDLTLDELTDSVKGVTGIFDPAAGDITVPDVPSRGVDDLVHDFQRLGRFHSISAMVSRFLLHGMRVPDPDNGVGDPGDRTDQGPSSFVTSPAYVGLYDVIGQQFSAPTGGTASYEVSLTRGPSGSWFDFASHTPDELELVLSPETVRDNEPSTVFDPQILTGPTAAPLFVDAPRRFALESSVHWQAGSTVPIPGPTGATASFGGDAGQPSVWLFPETLVTQTRGVTGPTGGTQPFELVEATPTPVDPMADRPVGWYAWGTAIGLKVARAAADDSGEPMRNGYIALGADQDGRDQLMALWTRLEATGGGATLYLLYSPSAASDNPAGLASDDLDASKTFLLKTNLSTETHSGVQSTGLDALLAVGSAGSGDYFARFDSPTAFLKYLWEGSITGTGGFYLNYSVAGSGGGLPAEVFSQGSEATLRLVVLLDEQVRATGPDRRLFPFSNCAVVGENVGTSASSLFARPSDPTAGQLTRVATVPPGTVGFDLTRVNPDFGVTGLPAPADRTRSLYSMVGFQVEENDFFGASPEGLPVGPLTHEDNGSGGSHARPPLDPAVWSYRHVVPVARFGAANAIPACAALPGPTGNPYAGIAGVTGPYPPDSHARLRLAFHDVYGNSTVSTSPMAPVEAPVGYTDALLGLASWPGAGFGYGFSAPGVTGGTGARLSLYLHQETSRYVAGAGTSVSQALRKASADAARYQEAYYQLGQRDVRYELSTNLGSVERTSEGLRPDLNGFVSAALLYLRAASRLEPVGVEPVAGDSLSAVGATYSVAAGALLEANKGTVVGDLFACEVAVPRYRAARAGDSLTTLAELGGTATPPGLQCPPLELTAVEGAPSRPLRSGGVRLADESAVEGPRGLVDITVAAVGSTAGPPPLTPADVADGNKRLPLADGLTLRVPAREFAVQGLTGPARTLLAIANRLDCNVYYEFADPTQRGVPQPLGLVGANLGATGVIASGVLLTVQNHQQVTSATSTFETIFEDFHGLGLSEGELSLAIGDVPGLLAEGASLKYEDRIIRGPVGATGPAASVTLADLEADYGGLDSIVEWNRDVRTIFSAGSPVYLNTSCMAADEGETVEDILHDAGITFTQLAAANASSPLNTGTCLCIPELTKLPADTDSLFAPYTALSPRTLIEIADDLGMDLGSLGELNAGLPYLLRPGSSVTYPGLVDVPVGLDSTLESVYRAFEAQQPGLGFDEYVEQLGTQRVVRAGAQFVATSPAVPAEDGSSLPLSTLAERFQIRAAGFDSGTDTLALARVNQALVGFLAEGGSIDGPGGATLTVGPYDTLVSMARRFTASRPHDPPVSVADLVRLNADRPGILTVGHRLLLPPTGRVIERVVAPEIPPAGASGERAVIFPVLVDAVVRRDDRLVSPDFKSVGSVCRAEAAVPPQQSTGSGDARLSLARFAREFETAFSNESLKAATSKGGGLLDPRRAREQIWAVNFGPSGIRDFDVRQSEPAFYALPPLATETVSGTVPVSEYRTGVGLCYPMQYKSFASVDMDRWMEQFLSTLDLTLSAAYAIPGFMTGATGVHDVGGIGDAEWDAVASSSVPGDGPKGIVGNLGLGLLGAGPELWGATGATGAPCAPGATAPYGPSSYEVLVQAKKDIADGLAARVAPVLETPGTDGFYLMEARETLRQQMLVRASSAYAFDGIVQYPVEVLSPFVSDWTGLGMTGPVPPRFSGSVRQQSHRVAATNLVDITRQFDVSLAYFAEVVLDVQGLIQPGVEIPAYGGHPAYTTGQNDTIGTLAGWFGVRLDFQRDEGWKEWRAFSAHLGAVPDLVVRGTALSLTRVNRAVTPADTLQSLADYFNIALTSLAHVVEDLVDLFKPGADLDLGGGRSYLLPGGQNVVQVVGAINAKYPEMNLSVGGLFIIVKDELNALDTSRSVSWVGVAPNASVSTAKVSLGQVRETFTGRTLDPALTFLFDVKQDALRKKTFLNLDYSITEVEYAIADVEGVGGYQASSWLTFMLPLQGSTAGGTALGLSTSVEQVAVPVPLRSYPTPPSLVGQSGVASDPDANTIPDARLWDYSFEYESRNADQDTDYLEVAFSNRRRPLGSLGLTVGEPFVQRLFPALAQFAEAYPGLKPDLARLANQTVTGGESDAAIAFQTFAIIADRVAEAFRNGVRGELIGGGPESDQVYTFQVDTATDSTGQHLVSFDLSLVGYAGGTASGLGPSGQGWPEVWVKSPTGSGGETGVHTRGGLGAGPPVGPQGFVPLELKRSDSQQAYYLYPEAIPTLSRLRQLLRFNERDLIFNENAWAGVFLTRNEDLISSGPLGPTAVAGVTGPIATNPEFVYRTPIVRFVNKFTPLITNQNRISVAAIDGGGAGARPLDCYLGDLFDALLDLGPSSHSTGTYLVKVGASFGYPLVSSGGGSGADAELLATTPLLLRPTVQIGRSTKAGFVSELSAAIRRWVGENELTDAVGRLVLQVTVFSEEGDAPMAAGATGVTQPILALENLQLDFTDVAWGATGPCR